MSAECRPPEVVDRMARAICRERCAYMGEPPCYDSAFAGNVLWPNPECDEPGCMAFAQAAAAAIAEPHHAQ